jgi:hypothetical protein
MQVEKQHRHCFSLRLREGGKNVAAVREEQRAEMRGGDCFAVT